jgi:hypothetical protein
MDDEFSNFHFDDCYANCPNSYSANCSYSYSANCPNSYSANCPGGFSANSLFPFDWDIEVERVSSDLNTSIGNSDYSTFIENSPPWIGIPGWTELDPDGSGPKLIRLRENSGGESCKPSEPPPSYQCESCPRTFTQRSNLKRHITTCHKGGKVYSCHVPNCFKAYKRSDALGKHFRTAHQSSIQGSKPEQARALSAESRPSINFQRASSAAVHQSVEISD